MRGRWITSFAVVAGLLLSTVPVTAQDGKGALGGGADQEAMMKEWAKWANPGEMHRHLEKFVGRWNVTMKVWMDPSAPAAESKGTCSNSLEIGGRWLRQEYKGEMMGMPYEGTGMLGYDNFRKQFVCSWADNTTTAMLHLTGTCNETGTEFNLSGTMDEPITGERDKKLRHAWKFAGMDSYTMELFDNIPGKGEVKVMELALTRVK